MSRKYHIAFRDKERSMGDIPVFHVLMDTSYTTYTEARQAAKSMQGSGSKIAVVEEYWAKEERP